MDLTEFLTARYEDEAAAAREACDNDSGDWFMGRKWNVYRAEDDTPQEDDETNRLVVEGNIKAQSEHIAYWNPSRVLADIAAKRLIVALHVGEHHCTSYVPGTMELDWSPVAYEGTPCTTLCLLAAPYADHPDFDEAWRTGD